MSKFYQQFFCPYDSRYSLIIDDDGRVSYAYLLNERNIIADVWLYNQQETPEKTNWSNKDDMPFLNSKEYVLDGKIITPIKDDSDIDLDWVYQDNLKEVKIRIRGELIAILEPCLFPGFSLLVYKDGPIAKKAIY
jgi:hypothetical protein